MPPFNLSFDKGKLPVPGSYFCTKPGCNKMQVIRFEGQKLKPCPECGGEDFKTV